MPNGASLEQAEAPRISEDERRPSARARAIVHRIITEHYDRPSLVSSIACEVGAEIIEGMRDPGDDLNSVELARHYRTSRTPVREALMLLTKEGLVQILPRRRPRVARMSLDEIREVYRVRAELLALIARQIASERTEDDLAQLRAVLATMERACADADVEAYFWANVEFHERSSEIAGNRTVKSLLDSLMLRTLPLRHLSLSLPKRMEESFGDHRRLVQAYEDRDERLAGALIRSNVINALAALEQTLPQNGALRSG